MTSDQTVAMSKSGDTPIAFAYHVPLNPYDPTDERPGTLIRVQRLRVGDRLTNLAYSETVAEEVIQQGSADVWEVVAIEPAGDEGQRATIRRKLGPDALWDGRLVLRIIA